MMSETARELYWKILKKTRMSGRISPALIEKIEAEWKAFDEDVVEEALLIHTSHYPDKRENYTLGIMKNLQKQKSGGKRYAEG